MMDPAEDRKVSGAGEVDGWPEMTPLDDRLPGAAPAIPEWQELARKIQSEPDMGQLLDLADQLIDALDASPPREGSPLIPPKSEPQSK